MLLFFAAVSPNCSGTLIIVDKLRKKALEITLKTPICRIYNNRYNIIIRLYDIIIDYNDIKPHKILYTYSLMNVTLLLNKNVTNFKHG